MSGRAGGRAGGRKVGADARCEGIRLKHPLARPTSCCRLALHKVHDTFAQTVCKGALAALAWCLRVWLLCIIVMHAGPLMVVAWRLQVSFATG